ncbi:hypothetical protein C8J57DRAFT_1222462 [Mycena rebaudengoi]|nr:hypothetical protein C8J57DRAFT_1222462 [Mycena rebaudengoi]
MSTSCQDGKRMDSVPTPRARRAHERAVKGCSNRGRAAEWRIVMIWLWPQAKKPGLFGFGTEAKAKPTIWPGLAFGLAWEYPKPKPGEKAMASDISVIICCRKSSTVPGKVMIEFKHAARPSQAKASTFGLAWDFSEPKPGKAGPKPWLSGQAKAKPSLVADGIGRMEWTLLQTSIKSTAYIYICHTNAILKANACMNGIRTNNNKSEKKLLHLQPWPAPEPNGGPSAPPETVTATSALRADISIICRPVR